MPMKPLLAGDPDKPLVSIIIPCYNAERWLSQAILSCLAQTYRPIEIIVIDDGSTDGSLDIIKSYANVITWETGPNRGGNAARNRGFALSSGEYIQFLDADDYLLPEKIERQVAFLESSGAAIVYGDWQYHYHNPDGTWFLGDIVVRGRQHDMLEALLSSWWVASLALLWHRHAVLQAGGWDEHLYAGQDKDILLSAALAGVTIQYQPGCYTVYRRHHTPTTVSTANLKRHTDEHIKLFARAEQKLVLSGRLSSVYRRALAHSYYRLACRCYDTDQTRYRRLIEKTFALDPAFRARHSQTYNVLQSLVGFSLAQKIAWWKRRVVQQARCYHPKTYMKLFTGAERVSAMQADPAKNLSQKKVLS